MRKINKNNLLQIIDKWRIKLNVQPNRIQIKKMKNKWSSCSSKGNIIFNSEITSLPIDIAEYIIVHELLHLIIPSHSKTFNVFLSMYLPNWKELHHKLVLISKYSILFDKFERHEDGNM